MIGESCRRKDSVLAIPAGVRAMDAAPVVVLDPVALEEASEEESKLHVIEPGRCHRHRCR